jgi:hypothetical protein
MSICDAFSSLSHSPRLVQKNNPPTNAPAAIKKPEDLVKIFVEKMAQGEELLNYPFKRWKDEVFVSDSRLLKVEKGQMTMAAAVKKDRQELRIHKLMEKQIPFNETELTHLFKSLNKFKSDLKNKQGIHFPIAVPICIKSKNYQLQAYLGKDKKIDLILTQPPSAKTGDMLIAPGGFKIVHHGWTLTGEPKHIAVAATLTQEDKYFKKAINEASFLDRFKNSSFTPKIYKSAKFVHGHDAEHVILMEYFPVTLFDRINEYIKNNDQHALTDREKLLLAYNIANAVFHFHSQGIVHKDLKLDNILEKDGRQVLCDLGFTFDAKSKDQCLDRAFTYSYLAPEMLMETLTESSWTEKHSYALDLWSLGCILWLILGLQYFPWHKECKEGSSSNWKEEALKKITAFASVEPPKTDKVKTLLWHILKIDPLERLSCEYIRGALWLMLRETPMNRKTYKLASEFQNSAT